MTGSLGSLELGWPQRGFERARLYSSDYSAEGVTNSSAPDREHPRGKMYVGPFRRAYCKTKDRYQVHVLPLLRPPLSAPCCRGRQVLLLLSQTKNSGNTSNNLNGAYHTQQRIRRQRGACPPFSSTP